MNDSQFSDDDEHYKVEHEADADEYLNNVHEEEMEEWYTEGMEEDGSKMQEGEKHQIIPDTVTNFIWKDPHTESLENITRSYN